MVERPQRLLCIVVLVFAACLPVPQCCSPNYELAERIDDAGGRGRGLKHYFQKRKNLEFLFAKNGKKENEESFHAEPGSSSGNRGKSSLDQRPPRKLSEGTSPASLERLHPEQQHMEQRRLFQKPVVNHGNNAKETHSADSAGVPTAISGDNDQERLLRPNEVRKRMDKGGEGGRPRGRKDPHEDNIGVLCMVGLVCRVQTTARIKARSNRQDVEEQLAKSFRLIFDGRARVLSVTVKERRRKKHHSPPPRRKEESPDNDEKVGGGEDEGGGDEAVEVHVFLIPLSRDFRAKPGDLDLSTKAFSSSYSSFAASWLGRGSPLRQNGREGFGDAAAAAATKADVFDLVSGAKSSKDNLLRKKRQASSTDSSTTNSSTSSISTPTSSTYSPNTFTTITNSNSSSTSASNFTNTSNFTTSTTATISNNSTSSTTNPANYTTYLSNSTTATTSMTSFSNSTTKSANSTTYFSNSTTPTYFPNYTTTSNWTNNTTEYPAFSSNDFLSYFLAGMQKSALQNPSNPAVPIQNTHNNNNQDPLLPDVALGISGGLVPTVYSGLKWGTIAIIAGVVVIIVVTLLVLVLVFCCGCCDRRTKGRVYGPSSGPPYLVPTLVFEYADRTRPASLPRAAAGNAGAVPGAAVYIPPTKEQLQQVQQFHPETQIAWS